MSEKPANAEAIEALLDKAVELDVHPIEAIISFAAWLDWDIATPEQKGDAIVAGMVIGTEDYIKSLLGDK